jgi:hypothetical protein
MNLTSGLGQVLNLTSLIYNEATNIINRTILSGHTTKLPTTTIRANVSS